MKSKTKKRITISLIIVLILIVAGIFILPKLIDPNNYRDLIVENMKEAIGGEISLGPISWGIANGIWFEVDGFSIINAPDIPGDVKLSRIYAKAAILPLLTMKVVLKKVLIESPELKMKLEPTSGGLSLKTP
jgi:AsmA protein